MSLCLGSVDHRGPTKKRRRGTDISRHWLLMTALAGKGSSRKYIHTQCPPWIYQKNTELWSMGLLSWLWPVPNAAPFMRRT